MPHLEKLQLSNTKITDAGLKYLRGLTQLQVLVLENTSITDAGLEYLESLTQLKLLGMAGDTGITRWGREKFKKAVPNCLVGGSEPKCGNWN